MKEAIGTLLVFHLLPGTPRSIHNRYMKKLYGEETSSWKGKYHYHRKGLLDEIPHQKLYTGVIIVQSKNAHRVLTFLGQYFAIIHVRKVKLTKDDCRVLGLPIE